MKQAITILLLLPCIIPFAQKKTTDPFAGLDTAFQRVLKDQKAAGFAVAVVKKDKLIYAKGFGYRDMEKKLPVTTNTLFAIGSCTKAFTSSLLGLLEKDGKIDGDKPVREYLPELHFFNDELNTHVTIRDMMCHRTGLPRHDYSWYLFNSSSKDSLLERIKYQEPTAPLRQTWQYNNFMFLAQGVITEKITGKSWEQNIKEKIFVPLEMKTANTSISELEKSNEPALGYYTYKDSIIKKIDYYNINGMAPAGSINSSVNEMANWVITWINGGKFKGKEVLPAPYVAEAMSSQMVIGGGVPDKEKPDIHFSNYGLGWFLASYRGHYRVEHGGNIDGFSASTCFFPSDSIGIIVLTNQNGSNIPSIVRNMIADRLLGLKYFNWLADRNAADAKAKEAAKEAEKGVASNRKQGTKPSHALKDYEGLYDNPGYGMMEIFLKDDSLIVSTRNGNAWLRHYHYDVFESFGIDKEMGIDTTTKNGLNFQFHMNAAGDIATVTMPLQGGLKDIEFTRKPKPKEVAKSDLEKYVADYEFVPGESVKFYIKGEKTLYAFIQGQPEYELVPIDKNKFSLKVLPAYKAEFEENDKGEIISVSFVQPNGTFKATRKK